jgi:hypothetical protein
MTKSEKQEMIRRCAAAGRVLWSPIHSVGRLVEHQLTEREIIRALTMGEVIEGYPQLTRYLPDCLLLGWLVNGNSVHIVVGCDQPSDEILIITLYRPTLEKWEDDYRTRKPKS